MTLCVYYSNQLRLAQFLFYFLLRFNNGLIVKYIAWIEMYKVWAHLSYQDFEDNVCTSECPMCCLWNLQFAYFIRGGGAFTDLKDTESFHKHMWLLQMALNVLTELTTLPMLCILFAVQRSMREELYFHCKALKSS